MNAPLSMRLVNRSAQPKRTLHALPFSTPLGELRALACADGFLHAILFPEQRCRELLPAERPSSAALEALHAARAQLEQYFAGRRTRFELPIAAHGTRFQLEVWHGLCAIPYGHTQSYAELARALERPNAVRAVGAANGQNRLPIVVPCHRVIGKNGSLTGYAGGLARKRLLLALEAEHAERR